MMMMMMMMMMVVVNSLVIPSHHSIPYRTTTAFTTFPTRSSSSNRIIRTWSSGDGQHTYYKLHPPRRSASQQSPHSMTMMMMMMIEYTEEGTWDDAFIQEQIALVPPVQTVHELPEPLSFHHNHNSNNHIQYYLLRHGQSTANVAEVISSDRYTLSYTEKHGLTELGKQQATASAQSLLQHLLLLQENHPNHPNHHQHRLIFVTSPFARARQTALACYHGIQDLILPTSNTGGHHHNIVLEIRPSILIHNALVERYFGIYDNDILDTYGYVWPLDQINVTQTVNEVESVAAVATRISTFLRHMDQYIMTHYDNNHNNKDDDDNNMITTTTTNHVVLVSHGDVVQIAQLYAANVSNIGEFSSYRFQSMCYVFVIVFVDCVVLYVLWFFFLRYVSFQLNNDLSGHAYISF